MTLLNIVNNTLTNFKRHHLQDVKIIECFYSLTGTIFAGIVTLTSSEFLQKSNMVYDQVVKISC